MPTVRSSRWPTRRICRAPPLQPHARAASTRDCGMVWCHGGVERCRERHTRLEYGRARRELGPTMPGASSRAAAHWRAAHPPAWRCAPRGGGTLCARVETGRPARRVPCGATDRPRLRSRLGGCAIRVGVRVLLLSCGQKRADNFLAPPPTPRARHSLSSHMQKLHRCSDTSLDSPSRLTLSQRLSPPHVGARRWTVLRRGAPGA